MKKGALHQAIIDHKYEGKFGWGVIFGRVLLGHLDRHRSYYNTAGKIVPMPAFLPSGTERRGNDHAGWVIECAITESAYAYPNTPCPYPFQLDPPLLVKTTATPKMAGANLAQRLANEQAIYDAVAVPAPAAVRGQWIVVVDDVFTAGSTLNAVARRLREAGAARVSGLTLSRQPWTSRG